MNRQQLEERLFDYRTGKWVSSSELKSNFDNIRKNAIENSTSEITAIALKAIKDLQVETKEQQDRLIDEYKKRISKYAHLEIIELQDEAIPDSFSYKETIFRIVHGNGYYVRQDPEECNKERLQDLVSQGYTNQEIADVLHMKPWTIQRRLQKYNIRRRKTYIQNRIDFDYDGLISDFLNGMKVDDICSKYEIDPKTYRKIKKEYLNNNQ